MLWEGGDINESAAVISNDPVMIYKEYDYLRENCPVAHVDRHGGYWLLTRFVLFPRLGPYLSWIYRSYIESYDDIKNAASDSDTFISNLCAVVPADPRGIRRPPLKFDGKDHTPYRTALDRTLKASRIKHMEPVLEAHAQSLLDKCLSRGRADICTDFGAPFCASIEKEWLNLGNSDADALAKNVAPFVQSWRTGDWDAVKKASDGFYVIARNVMADRKANPRDPQEDPASSLLVEEDSEGNALNYDHLV